MQFASKWMDPMSIMLSEVRKRQRKNDLSNMWALRKYYDNNKWPSPEEH